MRTHRPTAAHPPPGAAGQQWATSLIKLAAIIWPKTGRWHCLAPSQQAVNVSDPRCPCCLRMLGGMIDSCGPGQMHSMATGRCQRRNLLDHNIALFVKTSLHKYCTRTNIQMEKQSHRPVWWPAECHWASTSTPSWQHTVRRHHSLGQALHGFAAQSHGPSRALCPALAQSVSLRTVSQRNPVSVSSRAFLWIR